MHSKTTFVFLIVALLGLLGHANAFGYVWSCNNISLEVNNNDHITGTWLQADCVDRKGVRKASQTLKLADGITNNDGNLAWRYSPLVILSRWTLTEHA